MEGMLKCVLREGTHACEFQDYGKAVFHFKTCGPTGAVIDDSKGNGWTPFELRLGRKFSMEIWERAVKSMKIGEVATFQCQSGDCTSYTHLSMLLRSKYKPSTTTHGKHGHPPSAVESSCSGAVGNISTCSLGFMGQLHRNPDLHDLLGQSLTFEFELLRYEDPGTYEQEFWECSVEEKRACIPQLREDGNRLFREKNYSSAMEKYGLGLAYLERLATERPSFIDESQREAETTANDLRIPLLLNHSACALKLELWDKAIESAGKVLAMDSHNPKALFRRAQARAAIGWSITGAQEDLLVLLTLEPNNLVVREELARVQAKMKATDMRDQAALATLFT